MLDVLADPLRLFSLEGRKALVTGASRGIGRAVALAFAAAGADVTVLSRSEPDLRAVADQVSEAGRQADVVVADILDPGCGEKVEAAAKRAGGYDVLVNCAGESHLKDSFLDVPMDDWSKAHDLLLLAHVRIIQTVARQMVARQRGGSIINVASIFAHRGAPGGEMELGSVSYYTSAKHALVGLTRALAIELAPHDIRVNALSPGWTDTPMNPLDAAKPEFLEWNLAQIPMNRWARVDEMVGPALFLASNASSYMTGQSLVVDGGHIA